MVDFYIVETIEFGRKYINKFCSYRDCNRYTYNKQYRVLCHKYNIDKNIYYANSALQLLKMFS